MPRAAADMRPIFLTAVDVRFIGEIPVTVWQVAHSVGTVRPSSKLDA